jgi:hypothetical protein
MSTADIDGFLDASSSPLVCRLADHDLKSAVEALSRFPAETSLTVDRAAVTRADGMVDPLEQRLAEATAELKRTRQAQDEWAREVARLNQQISTQRAARNHAEKLAGRDTGSPLKPWIRIGVVAGVTCVAFAGILAQRNLPRPTAFGRAKQSTVAASIPLPGRPLDHRILPLHTPPAAARTWQKTFSPNVPATSTRIEQPPRRLAKAASRADDKSPSPVFTGSLQVRSSPASAVYLDRKYVGVTPLRLTALRAGSHAVWIQHDGYQRWTASVLVAADKQTQVVATLEPERVR